jgi:hypothetical protein
MRLIEHDLPANHRIILSGDEHIGAATCHMELIKARNRRIKSLKNAYLIGMGDIAEAIEVRDKRFMLDEHAGMTPVEQYAVAEEMLDPISDKLLCQIEGNHDTKLISHGTGSFVKQLCKNLDRPEAYGDYASVVRINAGDLSYNIYVWHGHGGTSSNAKDPEQRLANMKAAIVRKLGSQMSDCHVMAMGHIHKIMAFRPPPEPTLYADFGASKLRLERGHRDTPTDLRELQHARHIDQNSRWYAVTGTAKKSRTLGHMSWEETMGFGASDLGWVELVVDNGRLWVEQKFWGEGE